MVSECVFLALFYRLDGGGGAVRVRCVDTRQSEKIARGHDQVDKRVSAKNTATVATAANGDLWRLGFSLALVLAPSNRA